MLVTFGLLVFDRFPSDPWFIHLNPLFYANIFPSYYTLCWIYLGPWIERLQGVKKGSRAGSSRWIIIVYISACEVIISRDLLSQSEAQSWVPVRLQVPHGTGEVISADHVGVQSPNRNLDSSINLALHVQNRFIGFSCHESTQIKEYDQVPLSKHTINRYIKQRKCFHWLCQCSPCLSSFFLPNIQELIYLVMIVGIRISVSKFDVDGNFF